LQEGSLPRRFWLGLGLTLGSLVVTAWVLLGPEPSLPRAQDTPPATQLVVAGWPRPTPSETSPAATAPAAVPSLLPWDPPSPVPVALDLVPDGVRRTATVPILMYHYVGGLPVDADAYRVDLTVLPEQFEAQLAYLQRAGYTGISLADLVRHLATGSPLPPKPIVLTFDDGYVDNYLYAFPLLRQYGSTGTFFVVTGFLDEARGGYMTWEQARVMQEHGMDVQPHTVNHTDLELAPTESMRQEIAASQQAIEEHLGKPARLFAYPFGRYDAQIISALRSAGFWAAVTTVAGAEHSSGDLFELSRVRIHGADSLDSFVTTLSYYEE
jgi:peptidoglycan/xylan/chitin deacetylase (PgdA/CDA1 family)